MWNHETFERICHEGLAVCVMGKVLADLRCRLMSLLRSGTSLLNAASAKKKITTAKFRVQQSDRSKAFFEIAVVLPKIKQVQTCFYYLAASKVSCQPFFSFLGQIS